MKKQPNIDKHQLILHLAKTIEQLIEKCSQLDVEVNGRLDLKDDAISEGYASLLLVEQYKIDSEVEDITDFIKNGGDWSKYGMKVAS